MMKKKIILAILISLGISSLLIFIMSGPRELSGLRLDQGWDLKINGKESGQVSFPYYLETDSNTHAEFTRTLPAFPAKTLAIIAPHVTSLEVYWNGMLIHSVGDKLNPSGNLWNYYQVIELPQAPDGSDEITIGVTGLYDIHLARPPFIENRDWINKKSMTHKIIYNDFLLLAIGATMMLGLLLLGLSVTNQKFRLTARLFAVTAILAGLYHLDFWYAPSLGGLLNYIIFKKIVISSGFIATLAFILATESVYEGKIKLTKYLIIPSLLAVGVVLFVPDLPTIWRILPFLNLILYANLLGAVLLITGKNRANLLLLIAAFLLVNSLIQTILILNFHFPWPLTIQYSILFASILFGLQLTLSYNKVYSEHERLTGENIHDPLTGLYNRRVLDRLPCERFEIIVLIDLDNFKYYNDLYGHKAGDELLKDFSHLLSQSLRQKDAIIRWGGDEFLICLNDVSEEVVQRIFKKIKGDFPTLVEDANVGFSFGINKVEGHLLESIEKADLAMYEMKKEKKKVIEIDFSPSSISHRPFGNTGLTVTEISLGAMNLRLLETEQQGRDLINHALDRGINLIDTARAYKGTLPNGDILESEVIVGQEVTKRTDLDEPLIIVTKGHGYTPHSFDADLALSREKMGFTAGEEREILLGQTEIKLVYFFHGISQERWEIMKESGVLEHAKRVQESGLFTYLGFSSHTGHEEAINEALESGFFQVCELPYNVFSPTLQDNTQTFGNLFEKAIDLGIATINMKAFGGNGMVARTKIFQNYCQIPPEQRLRFCLSSPYVCTVDVGCRFLEELDLDIAVSQQTRFSRLEQSNLIKKGSLVSDLTENTCRECTHCLEKFTCPQGIDFPKILGLQARYKLAVSFEMKTDDIKNIYADLELKGDNCIGCNLCSPWCEYKLEIPPILKEAHENLRR